MRFARTELRNLLTLQTGPHDLPSTKSSLTLLTTESVYRAAWKLIWVALPKVGSWKKPRAYSIPMRKSAQSVRVVTSDSLAIHSMERTGMSILKIRVARHRCWHSFTSLQVREPPHLL